jgi:hypothetical protein
MSKDERERLSFIDIPDSLPIKFIKQFEDAIIKQHHKNVEGVIKKGGLHPREICSCIYDVPLQTYFGRVQEQLSDEQTIFAVNLIILKLRDFEKNEKKQIQTKKNI